MSTTISISGSGNADVKVFGNGTVYAGNGDDSIEFTGQGTIIIGSGHDTLTLGQGGVIKEYGAAGQDTINIGSGNATIYEQGSATVTGTFGSVTMHGGTLTITNGQVSGSAQGSHSTGGSMTHALHNHVFKSLTHQASAVQVVKNFVSGHDHAYLAGHSLAFLQQHHDVSIHGSSTHISMHGGGTTIELQGVHSLKATDMGGKH